MSAEGGFELRRVSVGEDQLITCVGGVGKVAAARAAEQAKAAKVARGKEGGGSAAARRGSFVPFSAPWQQSPLAAEPPGSCSAGTSVSV